MPRVAVDVLVAGAGPAGLACAIAASLRGMRVRVVEAAQQGPVDKACGEGVMPDALESLARLGVQVRAGHRLAGIQFREGTRVAEARFPARAGMGVRRTELHRAMLERAGELGIDVEWGSALRDLNSEAARFVVGADGGRSRVRALACMDEGGKITTQRIGLRQHFAAAPWSELVQVYWGDCTQAYVTPVSTEEVGVAFLSKRKFANVQRALDCFPELRDRLEGVTTRSTVRGALSVTRRVRQVVRGHVALVGDASGSVDAITGEGLTLCFRQAEALAEAMHAEDLPRYEQAHRKIMKMPHVMSAALLWMDQSAAVRRGVMTMLASCPGVFESLLAIHAGGNRRRVQLSDTGELLGF